MIVRVRLNGALSTQVGQSHLTVPLPDGANVADLVALLVQQHPSAREALSTAVPVSNGNLVSREAPLTDGQQLGLLMPISGG